MNSFYAMPMAVVSEKIIFFRKALQYSLQLADTNGAKKMSADWRCPPFGKFFNIGLNFENKAFFYIYSCSWVD